MTTSVTRPRDAGFVFFAQCRSNAGIQVYKYYERESPTTSTGGFQSRRLDNGVTDNFPLKISATQPHAVAFRPCALSELTLSIPARSDAKGISAYSVSTPWWFCKAKTAPRSSIPARKHAGACFTLQMKTPFRGFSFGGVSGNRTRACQFCRLKRYHFAITPYYDACAGYRAVVRLYQLFESVSSSSVMRCLFCSPKSGANSTWGRRWTRECFLR